MDQHHVIKSTWRRESIKHTYTSGEHRWERNVTLGVVQVYFWLMINSLKSSIYLRVAKWSVIAEVSLRGKVHLARVASYSIAAS